MDEKIRVGISPIYFLTVLVTIVSVVSFFVFSIVGLVDFRSEEERAAEHRESIINNPMFADAERYAKSILTAPDSIKNRDTVKRVYCVNILKSIQKDTKVKAVVIECYGGSYYYLNTKGYYVTSYYDMYYQMTREGKVLSELELVGEDLDILFEEAEKQLWH